MRFLSQTRRLLATVCIVTLCLFAFSVKMNPVNNDTQDEDSSVAILSETLTANKMDPATDQTKTDDNISMDIVSMNSVYQTAATTARAVSNATVVAVVHLSDNQSLTQTVANYTNFSPSQQSAGPDFPKLALANADSKTSTLSSPTKVRVETSTLRGSTKTTRMKSTPRRRNERSSSTTESTNSVFLICILVLVVIILLVICLYCFWPDNSQPTKSALPQGSISGKNKMTLQNPLKETQGETLPVSEATNAEQVGASGPPPAAPLLVSNPLVHDPTTERTTTRSMTTIDEASLEWPGQMQTARFLVKQSVHKETPKSKTETMLPRDDQSIVSGTYQTCLAEANPFLLSTEKTNDTVAPKENLPAVSLALPNVGTNAPAEPAKPEVAPDPKTHSEQSDSKFIPIVNPGYSQVNPFKDDAYRTNLSQANPNLLGSIKKDAPLPAMLPKDVSLLGSLLDTKSIKTVISKGKSVSVVMPPSPKRVIGQLTSKSKSSLVENASKEVLTWTFNKDKQASDKMPSIKSKVQAKEQISIAPATSKPKPTLLLKSTVSLNLSAFDSAVSTDTVSEGKTALISELPIGKLSSLPKSGTSHYKSTLSLMTLPEEAGLKVHPSQEAPIKSEELPFSSALALDTGKIQSSTLSVNSLLSTPGKSTQ